MIHCICAETVFRGSSWLNIYTTYFLDIAGVEDAFAYSTMVSCMGLIGVISSLFFVRYLDRRMIVMLGVGACGLCQLAFAVAWSAAPETAAAAKAVIAFMSIFTFAYVAYGEYRARLGERGISFATRRRKEKINPRKLKKSAIRVAPWR